MPRLYACLLMAAVLCGANAAAAQSLDGVDAANGERLARALCVNCHRVAPDGAGAVLADVPGFAEVANRPDTTRETIQAYVLSPHPAMPQIQFTRDELADISAYIMGLRED